MAAGKPGGDLLGDALLAAADSGHADEVARLLKAGATVHSTDDVRVFNHSSPRCQWRRLKIWAAMRWRERQCVRCAFFALLVSQKGMRALTRASRFDHVLVVQQLLEAGADVEAKHSVRLHWRIAFKGAGAGVESCARRSPLAPITPPFEHGFWREEWDFLRGG